MKPSLNLESKYTVAFCCHSNLYRSIGSTSHFLNQFPNGEHNYYSIDKYCLFPHVVMSSSILLFAFIFSRKLNAWQDLRHAEAFFYVYYDCRCLIKLIYDVCIISASAFPHCLLVRKAHCHVLILQKPYLEPKK